MSWRKLALLLLTTTIVAMILWGSFTNPPSREVAGPRAVSEQGSPELVPDVDLDPAAIEAIDWRISPPPLPTPPARTALRARGSLSIQVVDHDGKAVRDVPLVVRLAGERLMLPGRALGATDADGILLIDDFESQARMVAGMRKTDAFVVAVAAPGLDHVSVAVDTTSLPEEPLQIRLEPYGRLTVQVQAPDGELVDAAITVKPAPHRPGHTRLHRRDAGLSPPITFAQVGIGQTFEIEAMIPGRTAPPIAGVPQAQVANRTETRTVLGPRIHGEEVTVTIDQATVLLVGRLAHPPEGLVAQSVTIDQAPRPVPGTLGADGRFRFPLDQDWHGRTFSHLGFEVDVPARASGTPTHAELPEFTVGRSGIVDVGAVLLARLPLLVAGVVIGTKEPLVVTVQEVSRVGDDLPHGVDFEHLRFGGQQIAKAKVGGGAFRIEGRCARSIVLVRAQYPDGTVASRTHRVSVGTTGLVLEALKPGQLTLRAMVEVTGPLRIFARATFEDGTSVQSARELSVAAHQATNSPGTVQLEFPPLLPGRYRILIQVTRDLAIDPIEIDIRPGQHTTHTFRIVDERLVATVNVVAEGLAEADVHGMLIAGVPPRRAVVPISAGTAKVLVQPTGSPAMLVIRGRAVVPVTVMPGQQTLTAGEVLPFCGVDVVVTPAPSVGRCLVTFRWQPQTSGSDTAPFAQSLLGNMGSSTDPRGATPLLNTPVEVPASGRVHVELPYPGIYSVSIRLLKPPPHSNEFVKIEGSMWIGSSSPVATLTIDGSQQPQLMLSLPQ